MLVRLPARAVLPVLRKKTGNMGMPDESSLWAKTSQPVADDDSRDVALFMRVQAK